jgi:hypothetical protein
VTQLHRIRWAVRATLGLGIAASVTANVLHAQPNAIARAISAWPPVALLITIELISRVPVHRRDLAAARLLATVAIAGIAAWVSYWHMVSVVTRYGEIGAAPYLIPLSVDGLVVVASACLVELAGRIRLAEGTALAVVEQVSPVADGRPAGAGPSRRRGEAAERVAKVREQRPDMSPAELATASGVSVRHVRRLLAATGT